MHNNPWSLRFKLGSLLLLLTAATSLAAADNLLAFPGAQGAAAQTPGGRGGRIIRVTTLDASGPGSLLEALETKGPRIVVFEVGGVIDMQKHEIKIKEPFLTIAGQTAPSPGITLIRTGIDVLTHDVILQHIRVRTGSAGAEPRKGWEPDAFSTIGAYNVIVDHCSLTWAVDENLSASGPRFTGKTVADWRKGTSHSITFSNNIIAEGLRHSTHAKGEHSKGSLIHDNATDILIINNLYAHNHERNPLFKGGVHGMVINNLIYNPGPRAVHYNLIAEEWRGQPYQNGRLALIGNVLRGGPSTPPNLPLFMLGGSGDLEYYEADNIAVDWTGQDLPKLGRYTNSSAKLIPMAKPALPFGVQPIAAAEVQDAVILDAGARPWDRDPIDARIVADTIEGRGEIIDSEDDVGGYPAYKETRQKFDEKAWDLRYMTPRAKK
ncbi:pectate lyase family protein [Steroidobacter cummioxidans]|uniref:pectate lyase family protein n=1 Tax=Steroidobacter cummioxidans TaxID=1803913 RepID=UPI000E30BE42|nr:pectate lyase [Steroidobacter cummioxidans]